MVGHEAGGATLKCRHHMGGEFRCAEQRVGRAAHRRAAETRDHVMAGRDFPPRH